MSTYAESTQRHFWKFTADDLRAARKGTAAAAAAAAAATAAAAAPPTPAEVAWLRLHFEAKLVQFCALVEASVAEREEAEPADHEVIRQQRRERLRRRQRRVAHTALVYFKRVCLRRSLLDPRLNPRLLVLASIYMAAKVEEEHADITLRQLCEMGGVRPGEIIAVELQVLELIRFQVSIFHGFRSLEALLGKLKETVQWRSNLPAGYLARFMKLKIPDYTSVLETHESVAVFLRRRALELLRRCYYTDAVLMYSPSQLAISCIMAAVMRPGMAADVPEPKLIKQLKDEELTPFIVGFFSDFLKKDVKKLHRCMRDVLQMIILELPQRPSDEERAAALLRMVDNK